MLMVYNGLKSELNILAKFVFIYEKEISQMKSAQILKGIIFLLIVSFVMNSRRS